MGVIRTLRSQSKGGETFFLRSRFSNGVSNRGVVRVYGLTCDNTKVRFRGMGVTRAVYLFELRSAIGAMANRRNDDSGRVVLRINREVFKRSANSLRVGGEIFLTIFICDFRVANSCNVMGEVFREKETVGDFRFYVFRFVDGPILKGKRVSVLLVY